MPGETEFLELLKSQNPRGANAALPVKEKLAEAEEDHCRAFGYMRGLQEKALAIEFRLRTGDREWFPYSWLGPWRFNRSVGLLLKFTGDVVTLVLIRGSNLDLQVNQSGINLTDRGLQRHRITWIQEMDEDELRSAGTREPTVDGIDIIDFASHEAMQEWLRTEAPAFLRL